MGEWRRTGALRAEAGQRKKQILAGRQAEKQRQEQWKKKQIPKGNDRKKSKGNRNDKSNVGGEGDRGSDAARRGQAPGRWEMLTFGVLV